MRTLATVLLLALTATCWASPRSYLLVVSGIGGEKVYRERFEQWSQTMLDAAGTRLAMPPERVVYLHHPPRESSAGEDGPLLKAELQTSLSRIAADSEPGDVAVILFIGHGNTRREDALFNLPGPDLSAAELDEMLAALADRRVVIVNTAPSSAPFIKTLSRSNRVVITATASASERYHTIFPRHFVAAFAEGGADTDKNGRVSVAEAFEYARREVRRTYQDAGRLQTEHALLDDDGDGSGSMDLVAEDGDGALARTVFLQGARAAVPGASARLGRLLEERAALLERIDVLKADKQGMDLAEYEERLEELLVELALTSRAIREAEQTP
jgi:hypothetical protein